MKEFPALVPQEFSLEGRGYLEAAADIKLSSAGKFINITCSTFSVSPASPAHLSLRLSAGWVAVTAVEGDQLLLRVHGPQAAGFGLRTPPLLPHVISLKGERIRKSAAYKPMKAVGLLHSGLSTAGTERLQVKRKKKKN